MFKMYVFFVILGLSVGITFGQQMPGINITNLYQCVYQTPSYFWHTTTDDIGNMYMGLYTQGDGTERCAYIFKLTSERKLSIIYYDDARHIHTVAFNPVTKKLYATQGDDVPWLPETKGQSKFLVSDDYGVTWKVLQHYPRANYIPIVFDNKGCVIVGEDSAQYSPSSRLMRTCDDKRFETLIILSGHEEANWWSWYQSGSEMYMGTVVDRAGYSPTIWKSMDDGSSWSQIMSFGTGTQAWDGFHSMGRDRRGVLRYYFGNARKETSAFSLLMQTQSGHTN